MSTRDDDLEGLPLDALEGVPVVEPPADFADAVVAAWQQEQGGVIAPSTLRRRTAGVALVAAAAAAALVVGVQQLPSAPASGSMLSSAREQATLGERATVVAEAGADLTWRVARGGDAVVEQRAGRVFYRVEPGGDFVVKTPAGEARVTGTCFTLEIVPMTTSTPRRSSNNTRVGPLKMAGAALAGAALATVILTVQEGSVDLANDDGVVSVAAGEEAQVTAGEGPRKLTDEERARTIAEENRALAAERRALRAQVGDLEEQLKQIMIAQANGGDPLVAENRALKQQLETARADLQVEEQLRGEREGEPVAFPEDLSPAYREQGLKTAFLDMITKVGVSGDIVGIDCSEYPCVVFGEMEIPGDRMDVEKTWQKFDEQMRGHYPDKENNHWIRNSVHRDGDGKNKSMFGITITPKSHELEKDQKRNVNRRLQQRNADFFEATWANGD